MTSRPGRYREVFFAHNGAGPYECFYCHEPVSFEEVFVDHADARRENAALENLRPCHNPCHIRHHHKGKRKVIPPAQRTKMIEGIHRNIALGPNQNRIDAAKRRWANATEEERAAHGRGVSESWRRKREAEKCPT